MGGGTWSPVNYLLYMLRQLGKNISKLRQHEVCTSHCTLWIAKGRFSLKPFCLLFQENVFAMLVSIKAVGTPHCLILGKSGDSSKVLFLNLMLKLFYILVRKYKNISPRLLLVVNILPYMLYHSRSLPSSFLPSPSPFFPLQIYACIHNTQILLMLSFYELLKYSHCAPVPLNI